MLGTTTGPLILLELDITLFCMFGGSMSGVLLCTCSPVDIQSDHIGTLSNCDIVGEGLPMPVTDLLAAFTILTFELLANLN